MKSLVLLLSPILNNVISLDLFFITNLKQCQSCKSIFCITNRVLDSDVDEDKKQMVLKAAHSLMKGVRSMMTRDKTLTITPKKNSSKSLSSVGLARNQKPTLQLLSQ